MNPEQEAVLRAADPVALGRRIKAARVRRGLRQGELGRDDVSVAHVSRIESGKRKPSLALLEVLAGRLSVTADDLLSADHVDVPNAIRLEIDFAELALENADPIAAERHSRTAVDAIPENHPLLARARFLHARSLEAQGRLAEAIAELEPLVRPGSLSATTAAIALCRCLRETGELARSIEVGESLLAVLGELGLQGTDDAVQLVVTVAAAYYESGDVATAARLCREAVAAAEAIGSPRARASAYWNASMVESFRGNVAEAIPLAKRALALLAEGRDARNLARLRAQLGALQLRSEPPALDEALATLTAADAELRTTSASPVDLARTATGLARVHLLRGDLASAGRLADQALETLPEPSPLIEADARSLLGQVAARTGDPDQAQVQFARAAALLTSIGADRSAAQLWYELGACMDDLGMVAPARDAFRRAAASTGLTLQPNIPEQSDDVLAHLMEENG